MVAIVFSNIHSFSCFFLNDTPFAYDYISLRRASSRPASTLSPVWASWLRQIGNLSNDIHRHLITPSHFFFFFLNSNDPIKVSRHIAAIVNSKDDRGIVVGNWGEDFSGGTEPTGWHGSAAILQQFYRTKRSVKFGQCWVFSGVTCTSKK